MKYTVEVNDAEVVWYKEGTTSHHRVGGPAIERTNGDKIWYLDNNLHREGGPAIESHDGRKEWFVHGVRHREDGPAIEINDGSCRKAWYLNGRQYSEEEFLKLTSKKDDCSGKVVEIDGKKYKLVEV
jgi:hypothetical protein